MDWVKLATSYYNDPAIMRAGEAAEVLFTRALAYCGEQETDGFVPAEVLPRLTPTRWKARASALVAADLWSVVPGGWQFTGWSKHQVTADSIAETRAANRQRQQDFRERERQKRKDAAEAKRQAETTRNGVTNAVTNSEVTGTEVEEEVDAAAAASPRASTWTELPPSLEILRGKLDARKLAVRWDRLSNDQVDQIETLIEIHGDAPLIAASLASYRTDSPPQFAQAWLGTWSAIPDPGVRLALVKQERCPIHETTRSPAGVCAGCVTDARVGDL